MKHFRLPLWMGREDVAITAYLAEEPKMPGMRMLKRPAVVVVPGGGYLACSIMGGEGDETPAAFFTAGYQTFMLEYTVKMNAGDHPTAAPSALRDLGKAMMVIREHAEEWNVDPQRIAICGFSAGGHLCGMLATRWDDPILHGYFGIAPDVFRPQAAILCYPLTDYLEQKELPDEMGPLSNMALFGTEAPSPEQLLDQSPAHHISDKTPPIFLVHAMDDHLVTPLHTLNMVKACHEKGIPCEAHLFYQGGHGFGLGSDMAEPSRADRKCRCGQWFELALQWLSQQFAPDTKEQNVVPG